jgi:hypothetical protein
VTITSPGHGTARRYLTAGRARTFGAPLTRQHAADHPRASYGQDGMLDGVDITLAGSPAPPPAARPAVPASPRPSPPLGGGHFRITVTARPGTYATLRTTATGTAGNSITETIQRGYQIAP